MTAAVPDTREEALSPGWLTEALQSRFPGIEVVDVAVGPVVERISTNVRFTIECSGGVPDGLSPHLCVKGYFSETGRESRAAGRSEACFYRDIAADSGVRTLRSVYAGFDEQTNHGVVVTEDAIAQGGTFLDAGDRCDPDRAALVLEQFARLHASTWLDPRIADIPWLAPRLGGSLRHWGSDVVLERIEDNFRGENGHRVPEVVRDAERLLRAYQDLLPTLTDEQLSSGWSVIHGDAHVGNLMLDADGLPSLVDWQLVQRGAWYIDVGDVITTALSVEDRRRHERDLLAHYLECLRSFGAPAPDADDAWNALRHGIVHGFYCWGITSKVEPRLIEILLHRLGTAAADHDVFAPARTS
ncbi:phosphotransferase [Gordonia sp. CPCC 206044]|uniref:phosphotransferase n=1 Tax=Gordonia sp. CPCC 206044 TaxID=3140793 RepID=UPI003AF34D32